MDGSRFDELARRLGRASSRRTLLRGIAGGLTGLVAGSALARHDASARTLTICHATGDPNAPWQALEIDQSAFNLHARHGDFVRVECCANSDCAALDGVCATGACQNGYCVQLPTAAGIPCDDQQVCTTGAVCDGAFNCAGGDAIVCAETENPCTTAVCSEAAQGCIDVPLDDGSSCGASDACVTFTCRSGVCHTLPNTTAACQTPAGNNGQCGEDGVCHPICSATVTCANDDQCGTGRLCLNGGCFRECESGDCSTECANCFCTVTQRNPVGRRQVCADAGFGIGTCTSSADCPQGSYCNPSFGAGSPNTFLCTRPCPETAVG